MFHSQPAAVHALPYRWRTEMGGSAFIPAVKIAQGGDHVIVTAEGVNGLLADVEATLAMFGLKPERIARFEQEEERQDKMIAAYRIAIDEYDAELQRLRNAYDDLLLRTTPELQEYAGDMVDAE